MQWIRYKQRIILFYLAGTRWLTETCNGSEKKKTVAAFLNCLINFCCILFQDLAYMKIKGDDHWLFYEYPFNTDQFATYVEEAKKSIIIVKIKMQWIKMQLI